MVFVQHLAAHGISGCVTGVPGECWSHAAQNAPFSTGFAKPEVLVLCWKAAGKGEQAVLVWEVSLFWDHEGSALPALP